MTGVFYKPVTAGRGVKAKESSALPARFPDRAPRKTTSEALRAGPGLKEPWSSGVDVTYSFIHQERATKPWHALRSDKDPVQRQPPATSGICKQEELRDGSTAPSPSGGMHSPLNKNLSVQK